MDPFHEKPRKGGHRRGDVGHHEGACCEAVRSKGASCVETEPSEPQQSRAGDGHGQIVRDVGGASIPEPPPHNQRSCEGGNPRADVHHRAACKVQGPHLGHPSSGTPDPVSQGIVNKGCPKNGKKQEGYEFHSFSKGAGDQGRRDDGEHALKNHESQMGDGRAVGFVGFHSHPFKTEPVQATDDAAVVRAEGQRISPQHPFKGDEGKDDVTLHNGSEHVFASDHASIEKGQPRGHEHDQC